MQISVRDSLTILSAVAIHNQTYVAPYLCSIYYRNDSTTLATMITNQYVAKPSIFGNTRTVFNSSVKLRHPSTRTRCSAHANLYKIVTHYATRW